MKVAPFTAEKYTNIIHMVDGVIPRTAAMVAIRPDMRAAFSRIADSVSHDDPASLKTAHDTVIAKLGAASVEAILEEIHPGLAAKVSEMLGAGLDRLGTSASSADDLATAFANVKSMVNGPTADLARAAVKKEGLVLTTVAYADGHRIYGVSGDDIADVRLNAEEPSARRMIGSPRPMMACPFVKDSNWKGPFGEIDLAAFTVKNKDGRIISLQDVLENPAKHINGWAGPQDSLFDAATDNKAKAAVMDVLVPAADGNTETRPSINTYNTTKLVLVIVPGEGISAHFTDGSRIIDLPIHSDGRERALRVTRQQFSSIQGTTSFDRGASAADDMLANSAMIVQIPVVDPTARPRPRYRAASFGGALEGFGGGGALLGATRSMTRGGAASVSTGQYGTEAGMVEAGRDLGAQKAVPGQIRRVPGQVRVDFVLYAATDANVITPGLAKRMREDMDRIIKHPACTRAAVENHSSSPGGVW